MSEDIKNLDDLISCLEGAVRGTSGSQYLLLGPDLLKQAGVLVGYLKQDNSSLRIDQLPDQNLIQPDKTNGVVRIVGNAALFKDTVYNITIAGQVPSENKVRLNLSGRPPSGSAWKFADNFVSFPDYLGYDNEKPGLSWQPSFYNDIGISSPIFWIYTYPDPEDKHPEGLSLEASLDVMAGTIGKHLKSYMPASTSLHLNGGIVMRDGGNFPLLDLSASVSGIDVDPLRSICLRLRTIDAKDDDDRAASLLTIIGSVTIRDLPTLVIEGPILQGNFVWVLRIALQDPKRYSLKNGLSALTEFVGGHDLTLPAGMDKFESFYLDSITVGLEPKGDRPLIDFLGASIRSPETWSTPIPGISITDICTEWQIMSPFSNPVLLGNVGGTVLFGPEPDAPRLNVEVDLSGSTGSVAPSAVISAYLDPHYPISIDKVFKHFTGIDIDLDLEVSDLRLKADTGSRTLFFYSQLKGDWDPLKPVVAFKNIGFELSYSPKSLSGSVVAQVEIAKLPFAVEASHPAPGQGWRFEGYLLPTGEAVTLKDFLNNLVPNQLPDMPEPVGEIELTGLSASFDTKTGEFSFSGSSASPWSIPLGFETAEISDVSLSLKRTVEAATQQKKVSGEIKGNMRLGEASFDVDYKFPGNFVLQGRIEQMDLMGLTEQLLQGLGVPDDLPDLIFKDIDIFFNPQKKEFNISGRSSSTWTLPFGSEGMQIQDLFLQAHRTILEGGAAQVGGRISGTVSLAGTSVTVDLQLEKAALVLSGKVPKLGFSSLVQDLCGNQAAQNTLMPPGVQALDITDLNIFLDVGQKTFTASCKSGLGEMEVLVKKVETTWGFICGLVPPQNWKFSAISQELKSLDAINFHNTAMIVSSTDDTSFSLTKVQTPRKDLKIIRGLNLFFGMDLSSVKADRILGKTDLEIYAAVGSKISDLVLETKLAGEIRLAEGLILGGVVFRLVPNPANFSLALLCVLNAKIRESMLKFTGGIIISGGSASMAATMQGVWDKPFGFNGVAIANVALNLGFSYTAVLPMVGIAGALQVGDFKGSAAIMFDPGAPTKSMVAVDFNRLYFIDILKTFCSAGVWGSIPEDVIRTVLNIGFENSKVYIVPQATQIGELKYEQGFRLSSKLTFMGLKGYADLKIDHAKGISAEGDIDEINLGGIFALRGANGKPKPAMKLSIIPRSIPVIYFNGGVSLLGLSSSVDIQFSKDGFFFKTEGKIFTLFQASLEVRGDISKSQGIYVKAYLKNDLFVDIREKAEKFINDITQSAISKLTNAQNEISNAKVKVDGLLTKISEMRVTVNNEKQKAREGLQSAQRKLTDAQNKVNSLQNEINQAKDKIRSYENDIRWWNSWYNNLNWWEKTYEWVKLAYEVGWRGGAIAGLYIKIGAIEAAKLVAIGVLEAAKLVLRGLEETTKLPVDMDPRILALIVAHTAATAALDIANGALELLKKALGGMARVATFIINAGLGGIIDIRGAQFEGSLSLTSGAKISLRIDMTFMNGPIQTYQLDFDFKNPISAIQSLVTRALPSG